jgi:hypothetical protein
MPKLIKGLFGDKGYLSKPLPEHLLVTDGIRLITKLRKQIRNRLFDLSNKHLLRKRAIIKAINDQLKNTCQIEHSRHRSPINFLVNLVAGLIGYCHLPKEPSLGLQPYALPPAQVILHSRSISNSLKLPLVLCGCPSWK